MTLAQTIDRGPASAQSGLLRLARSITFRPQPPGDVAGAPRRVTGRYDRRPVAAGGRLGLPAVGA